MKIFSNKLKRQAIKRHLSEWCRKDSSTVITFNGNRELVAFIFFIFYLFYFLFFIFFFFLICGVFCSFSVHPHMLNLTRAEVPRRLTCCSSSCLCIDSFKCGICFVIVCSPSLLSDFLVRTLLDRFHILTWYFCNLQVLSVLSCCFISSRLLVGCYCVCVCVCARARAFVLTFPIFGQPHSRFGERFYLTKVCSANLAWFRKHTRLAECNLPLHRLSKGSNSDVHCQNKINCYLRR